MMLTLAHGLCVDNEKWIIIWNDPRPDRKSNPGFYSTILAYSRMPNLFVFCLQEAPLLEGSIPLEPIRLS